MDLAWVESCKPEECIRDGVAHRKAQSKDGARPRHTSEFAQRTIQIGQVLENAEASERVKFAVRKRHVIKVALVQLGLDTLVIQHPVDVIGLAVDIDRHQPLGAAGKLRKKNPA